MVLRRSLQPRLRKRAHALLCLALLSLTSAMGVVHAEEDLVILDEPAPGGPAAAAPKAVDADITIGDDSGEISISDDGAVGEVTTSSGSDTEEVSLDALNGGSDFFNPYVFERDPLWTLLPALSLILVGLHLLPVPKMKRRKLVPITNFFRHAGVERRQSTQGRRGTDAAGNSPGRRASDAAVDQRRSADRRSPTPSAPETLPPSPPSTPKKTTGDGGSRS